MIIYALFSCVISAHICQVTADMPIFHTRADCERMASFLSRSPDGTVDKDFRYVCMSRHIDTWQQ